MPIKNRNFFSWKFPRTQVNQDIPFEFRTYALRNDGYIFLSFNLFFPLIVLMITSFTLDRTSLIFSLVNVLITFIGLSFTAIYFGLKSFSRLVNSGLLIYFLFNIIPIFLFFIFNLIIGAIDSNSQWIFVGSIWVQIIAEILVIALAFKFTSNLKERFKLTFKNNKKLLILFMCIGVSLMWVTATLYGLIFADTPLVGESNNQDNLAKILREPESKAIKIFYIFTLSIFTVLVAPLAEELAFRHSWFIGTGHRLIGFLTAPLYFGFIHVQSGDVEHILSYVLSGLVLTFIFDHCQGNVVYSWLTHLGWNLLVLILLLV